MSLFKILMLSRGIPSKYHPQWGCFEKDQAEALAAYGHKVVVISVDARFKRHKGHFGLHHVVNNGVEYYNYVVFPGVFLSKIIGVTNNRMKVHFYYVDKMFQQIVAEHGKPDILYSQFYSNTMLGVKLKQKYNIPLVGIEHLSRFNEKTLSKDDVQGATYAFQGVDTLIAVSKSLADNLEKRFGVKSLVIHNMYGPEFGKDSDRDFISKVKKPIVFIATASLIYRKGFDMLINAFAKAQLPKGSWKLNIIGWGEEKKNLEQLIGSCGLHENIFLLGKKGKVEIANELSVSHVFVLPSRNENFSVAILEALSMGLPVIATDCGGIRECLNDKNGMIVPVDDIDAMAGTLRRMVDTYTQYDSNYIAEDCKKRFSPMAIAEKLTTVFEDTIRNVKS